jgi:perosamine synthetase
MIKLVAPVYDDADRQAIRGAATDLTEGEHYVTALEARLASMFGAEGAVCTTSGTAALHLALMAGVSIMPCVEMPTFSCVALVHATRLADMEENVRDCLYSPETMEYGSRNYYDGQEANEIVPHMFGVLTQWERDEDWGPLGFVIEDWAMSLGATPSVIHGSCAVLSFHESKMVSGQHGGAVVTNDPDLLASLRDLNAYNEAVVADRLSDDVTYVQRVNYRMSGLNAALVLSQLDKLPSFVARRAAIAAYYNDALANCPAILPTRVPEGSVFGRYVMALTKHHPVDAINALAEKDIEAGRGVAPCLHHYLHLPASDFPQAERAYQTVLSLPVWPGLTDSQVEHIAKVTKDVLCAP